MLPIRLEMRNFLPYRNPDPLYFDGIHLACLTGHNGAGKSSILDAITWVLWGRARAKTEGELVHLGQSDMHVQLEFEQDGAIYQVLRQRSAGKNGKGSLQLYIRQADGTPQLLNAPNMRDTQKHINDILKLDYETFISSAFLQQGKADAFTTKTPAERKKTLSDILGIERWTVYEDRAKAQLKTIGETLMRMNGSLSEIEEELRKEPHYQKEQADAQEAFNSAEVALKLAQDALKEVEHAPAELRGAREKQTDLARRLTEIASEIADKNKELAKHQTNIDEYMHILNDQEHIAEGYQTLQIAREQDSSLGEQLRQVRDLESQRSELEKRLQAERNQIEQQRTRLSATLQELERILQSNQAERLLETEQQLTQLQQSEQERETLTQSNATHKEERGELSSHLKSLTKEGKELNERIETLEHADGATCPLCGQVLTDAHRTRMLAELNTQRDDMRMIWTQKSARLSEVETLIKTNDKNIDTLGTRLARLPALQSEFGKLQKQQADVLNAQTRLIDTQAEYDALSATLQTDDFAPELREALAEVETTLANIGYDGTEHANIQQMLKQYSSYEVANMRLEVAKSSLPIEQASFDNVQQRLTRLSTGYDTNVVESQQLEEHIEALKLLVNEFQRRDAEVKRQHTQHTHAYGRLTVAQQQLSTIEIIKQKRARLEEQREAQLVQQSLYDELRLAFGKNGVPAMIIESAIPELELLANDLLTRMTDGRMHLRLTTQQEKSDGGVKETLDIEIADDLGTRAYEMYSGGEAFRINFALRVALSKLLSRRAGAQLQTLFIDEGFGTQDEDGRSKLVEAINAVQDDFKMILVITHMEDLRDSFPVHVIVEKTKDGSLILVQ